MTGGVDADRTATARGGGFFVALLTARGFTVAWLTYVLANALIRYSLTHTLATDDAPESLIVQTFQLGYGVRHPPLWEWLLWSIQQVIGPGFESHLLLRYGCIALLGIATFRACRAVTGDVPWSAATALALPLVYQLGWPFFEWGTHTLVLAVVCLLTLEVAIRYAADPSYALAALIGALVGLGFLAKYGYAVFLVALVLAMLVRRDTRVALFRRELLLVPVVALIVLSPFLYWLVETRADLVEMSYDNLVQSTASHGERVMEGLDKFAQSSLRFLVPWPIILAIAVWEGRRREKVRMASARPGEWIAGLVILFSVAITVGGIVALGITKMSGGYIVPIWIAVLPYSAGLLARAAPGIVGPRRLAVLSLTVLAIVTVVRLVYLGNSGFSDTSYRREMWPFAGLASAMREAGLDRGTLVTVGGREGGNLRAELPQIRVVSLNPNDPLRPSLGPGHDAACRLLWNNSPSIAPDKRWARSRDPEIVAGMERLSGKEQRHFDIPWAETYIGVRRISRWTLIDLDPDDPLCR